jgi:hypothetical protein
LISHAYHFYRFSIEKNAFLYLLVHKFAPQNITKQQKKSEKENYHPRIGKPHCTNVKTSPPHTGKQLFYFKIEYCLMIVVPNSPPTNVIKAPLNTQRPFMFLHMDEY